MRTVKINFRIKRDHGSTASWKVYTTLRTPSKHQPVQIHIGYLPEITPISEHNKEKLLEKLKNKWLQHFGNKEVEINWEDAQEKFASKVENKSLSAIPKSKWKEANILCSLYFFLHHPDYNYMAQPYFSFESLKTGLSIISGYSEGTVEKYIKQLAKTGLVYRDNNGRHSITEGGKKYLENHFPEFTSRYGFKEGGKS